MNKKFKQKEITIEEYNKTINAIIKKGKPVSDTLIEMLNEASKYKIEEKTIKTTRIVIGEEVESRQVLYDFVNYCVKQPKMSFWSALSKWEQSRRQNETKKCS